MADYRAPIADISHALTTVAGLDMIASTERFGHADPETVLGVIEEVGRFMTEVIAPTNRDGDNIRARDHNHGRSRDHRNNRSSASHRASTANNAARRPDRSRALRSIRSVRPGVGDLHWPVAELRMGRPREHDNRAAVVAFD